jgi:ParB family transcriptional regulator, chromosome partitioning protein
LLDLPGYDVAALVEKSGKSASHIYARLSLLQLIPAVAEAFQQERITASHAALIARLPQEHQADAFDNCWRKDWQDKEAHLLPAKHLSAWIQSNLYLNLADAPFDREDPSLNPTAGACVTCPRRSGFNTSLFADVQGDQCLDAPCFHAKVTAHIDREIAARPELVTIETAWRAPKEQHPGALQKHQYRELDIPDNPDAEPPCSHTKSALIVFGKHAGRTLTVCVAPDCPVHNRREAARVAADPPPIMAPAAAQETEEEAAQREAEHEERMAEYRAEQERKEEERKAESGRQQKEYEAEQARREKHRKARLATFDRILEQTPAVFTATQLRLFLRLVVYVDPYSFLEEVASHFSRVTVGFPMHLIVTEFVPGRRLAWSTLVDGDETASSAYHGWVITPTDTGCHLLSEETQQGPFFLEEFAGWEGHDAGVVDVEVEGGAGKTSGDAGGEGSDGGEVGEVECFWDEAGVGDFGTNARHGVSGFGGGARGEDDFGAGAGELEGGVETDAGVGSGDEDAAIGLRGDVGGRPLGRHGMSLCGGDWFLSGKLLQLFDVLSPAFKGLLRIMQAKGESWSNETLFTRVICPACRKLLSLS